MRNTHIVQVTLKRKDKETTDQVTYLARHLIESITPNEGGCLVVMTSGAKHELQDKTETLIRRCKDVGVMTVVA